MPLIDAYIKCTGIDGSYTASTKAGASTKLAKIHDGWSEIYTFKYEVDENEYPSLTITKPVDRASNDLYVLYLKSQSRNIQKSKDNKDLLINEIQLDLCRWMDKDQDGIVDEFKPFVEYSFRDCRVLNYSTDMDFSAEDIPEESIKFGFAKISMRYYHKNGESFFRWFFANNKKAE